MTSFLFHCTSSKVSVATVLTPGSWSKTIWLSGDWSDCNISPPWSNIQYDFISPSKITQPSLCCISTVSLFDLFLYDLHWGHLVQHYLYSSTLIRMDDSRFLTLSFSLTSSCSTITALKTSVSVDDVCVTAMPIHAECECQAAKISE